MTWLDDEVQRIQHDLETFKPEDGRAWHYQFRRGYFNGAWLVPDRLVLVDEYAERTKEHWWSREATVWPPDSFWAEDIAWDANYPNSLRSALEAAASRINMRRVAWHLEQATS